MNLLSTVSIVYFSSNDQSSSIDNVIEIWSLLCLFMILDSKLDIRNWIRNIEQHASDNVNKILVGNKADMDESKRVNCITE